MRKDGLVRGEQGGVERRDTSGGLANKLLCAGAEEVEPGEAREEPGVTVKGRNCWNSQHCPNGWVCPTFLWLKAARRVLSCWKNKLTSALVNVFAMWTDRLSLYTLPK